MMASFLRTRGQGARVSVDEFEGSTNPVARSDGRLWDRGRDHARGQAFLTASSRLRWERSRSMSGPVGLCMSVGPLLCMVAPKGYLGFGDGCHRGAG